jgi:lipopolysaccharide export system permease protein
MATHTIDRYLISELIRPTLVSTGIMLLLVWLIQSLRFLDLIINKGLSLFTFLHLTLFLVPFLLTFILPLALFAGACVMLKRLNDESEIPPLFGAGLSNLRLIRPFIFMAFVGIGVGYGISLYVLPMSMTAFKDMQHELRNTEGHLFLEAGSFNQLDDGLMVYLKRRTGPYEMEGLLVHDSKDNEHPVTWMAKRGKISATAHGSPKLTLEEGIRQDVTPNQVSMLQFREHTMEISRAVNLPGPRSRSIEEYSLEQLQEFFTNPTPEISAKDVKEYRAEWHKRLLWPLTPLPLILIAAALLLRGKIRREGIIGVMVMAILCAVVYQSLLLVAHSLATKGIEYVLIGQWALPPIGVLMALIIMQRGARV